MTDEFAREIAHLSPARLQDLRTAARNEITLLRSEQNNGGPDRSALIELQQKKLHIINARLKPAP
jgi:hypothetical protein